MHNPRRHAGNLSPGPGSGPDHHGLPHILVGYQCQAKQWVDRLCALDYGDNFKGKKLVLLMTYSGPEPNTGIPIINDMFEKICTYLKINFIQSYGVRTLDRHVKNNPKALEAVRIMAQNLPRLL